MKVGLRRTLVPVIAAATLLCPSGAWAAKVAYDRSPSRLPRVAFAPANVAFGSAARAAKSAPRVAPAPKDADLASANRALRASLTAEKKNNRALEAEVSSLNKQIASLLKVIADLRFRMSVTFGPWQTSTASTYGIGDGLMGSGLAGSGHLDDVRAVFAHRSMPFGTKVQFTYQGRSIIGECQDRGPFVAGREFDLGPKIARSLGFGGVAGVKWRVIHRK
jgi:rare lipoprotein A (peptidoglycan hydrolase)